MDEHGEVAYLDLDRGRVLYRRPYWTPPASPGGDPKLTFIYIPACRCYERTGPAGGVCRCGGAIPQGGPEEQRRCNP
jgi:hypothetical protein